jgi:AAA-like domain
MTKYRSERPNGFFVTGGALEPDSPCYVERDADKELFQKCKAGELCYVLTSRQMGKTSLMARTAQSLQREEQISVATVDLSQVGQDLTDEQKRTPDRWCFGVARKIQRSLDLRYELLKEWWRDYADLPAVQRLAEFITDAALSGVSGRLVIFIDEIDTTIGLPFSDDFFAAIRACYNARSTEPELRRLGFVLLGVASPSDLIADVRRTPFNIGHRIELTDFTFDEARPLAAALPGSKEERERQLRHIVYWTEGHPYMTQKLCQILAQDAGTILDDAGIDAVVERHFLDPADRNEPNLRFVRDRLTNYGRPRRDVLRLYEQIRRGETVQDMPLSPTHNALKLSGVVVTTRDGTLRTRNRIYERLFTVEWSQRAVPVDYLYITGGAIPSDSPGYIERVADEDLYRRTSASEFCYVLASRQSGKSSLMVRTAARLRHQGVGVAVVDLTQFIVPKIKEESVEHWYYGLILGIQRSLPIQRDLEAWWREHGGMTAVQRFTTFLTDVVLAHTTGAIVIFIDEIDAILGLPLSNDFFSAIRACYNARSTEPELRRLGFVLLGVASQVELIRDLRLSPFNIGYQIELTDFSFEEARPLASGLADAHEESMQQLDRVLYWTGGHPYMTQRLCAALAEAGTARRSAEEIDSIVTRTFLDPKAQYDDSNISFVRHRLTSYGSAGRDVLRLYAQIRRGESVRDEPLSSTHNALKLSGVVVTTRDGKLRLRNKVYERIFTVEWTKQAIPVKRNFYLAAIIVLLFLVAGLVAWLLLSR